MIVRVQHVLHVIETTFVHRNSLNCQKATTFYAAAQN